MCCPTSTQVHAVFVREAIRNLQLTIWEAFTIFDADNNGMLSPAELFGAMRWLGVPDCTAEDVVDFINAYPHLHLIIFTFC